MRETASSETDCTSDSAQTQQQSESRVSAKARNPANEMRFPVSREAGGNASALAPCRGGRRRQSLAKQCVAPDMRSLIYPNLASNPRTKSASDKPMATSIGLHALNHAGRPSISADEAGAAGS